MKKAMCVLLFSLVLLSVSEAFKNDYDGDANADLAVYELPSGNWFIRSLGNTNAPPIVFGQNWGLAGVVPVAGDYNGDGIDDLSVYESSFGNWFIRSLGNPSAPPITFAQNWGNANMDPVSGDYNFDSVWDLAAYERSTGDWYIRSLGPGNPIAFGQNWGSSNTEPVPGDYNGDGVWDLAAYEPSTGNWYIRSLGPGNPIAFGQSWGNSNTEPVPGDYNGDGVWDLAVYEPSTGNWYIRSLGPIGPANPPITFGENWGFPGVVPVPGDFNNDGVYDLAVYELATGDWYIRSLGSGPPIAFKQNWGFPGAVAVPALSLVDLSGSPRALNRSTATLCAEEDNVNVPLMGNVQNFTVTATHPTYNVGYSCAADFTNCGGDTNPVYNFTPGVFDLFDDGNTVVQAVRYSQWWQPSGMTASVLSGGQASSIHSIVIYRKIADVNQWPQFLVLYADGNMRLIPHPPAGRTSVCFGSSVIVGPAAISSRPIAEIASVTYAPSSDTLQVSYVNGGTATIRIAEVTRALARVQVTVGYSTAVPFATFRSMYVIDGNSDIDRVKWRTPFGHVHDEPIMSLSDGAGTEWFFYRGTTSIHNPLGTKHYH